MPHIAASSMEDLFFAQGFVQAQDRLFQMDLWRRSSLGRLSAVLGANFVQRDAMTRRIQYRGDRTAEWQAYGNDAHAIATAFVSGINAFVDQGPPHWPDEFRLAGWTPEHWAPEDLLNRTDAFASSRGAEDEVFCAELLSAGGVPLPTDNCGRLNRRTAVDLATIPHSLGDMPRRVGARPFFAGFAAPYVGSNAWAIDATRTRTGGPLLAADPHRSLDAPSLRYLIHLTAPGWNAAGATAPWLPGIVIGHNQHVAWAMTALAPDVQDIYVERLNPADAHQVEYQGRWENMTIVQDSFAVKGREEPFDYEQQYTRHGPVIGLDRERHLAYTLRWPGTEPGAAAELGNLRLLRAGTLDELNAAIDEWKMPAVEFVVAADDGRVGSRVAALRPVRRGYQGDVPVEGWSGRNDWVGFEPAVEPSGRSRRPSPIVVSANADPLRAGRIARLLTDRSRAGVLELVALQSDAHSVSADVLLLELARVPVDDEGMKDAATRLLAWDRRMDGSPAAVLFQKWEDAIARAVLAAQRTPATLMPAALRRDPLLAARWAASEHSVARKRTLLAGALRTALAAATGDEPTGGRQAITFTHPLAISPAARERFNAGPFTMFGSESTVQMIADGGRVGPGFRAAFDVANWDASHVVNAPGQSGWPDSPHYRDLAAIWSEGKTFPLAFTAAAVERAGRATLALQPAAR